MKENYIYPVIIKKRNEKFEISFPNFPDQMTEADTEDDAIIAAQEVLALCISDNEEMCKENPISTEQEKIKLNEGEKLVYVHVWMPYFRQVERIVYVKKTLTIPQWIDQMAKAKNVNFSAVLVKGLKAELGLKDR